jgi:hypothetical protein
VDVVSTSYYMQHGAEVDSRLIADLDLLRSLLIYQFWSDSKLAVMPGGRLTRKVLRSQAKPVGKLK